MMISSEQAEREAIMNVAKQMAAAARTAPKTRGRDYLETVIVAGEELKEYAARMEDLGEKYNLPFMIRDSKSIRESDVVVFFGIGHHTRDLNEACQYCGSDNCGECMAKQNSCVYDPIDLGIALSSAVSIAADNRIDNRIMFSVGRAAKSTGIFGDDTAMVFGIPLSAKGKSNYYDR
ncbi:ferredoxin domain-containing protein [Dorea sp. D27]|uniref:ferredoxin domain-containing protein n=1 Tax=Dorea sp. D27 TaxID=658665 RepID=UPI0006730F1E|nr:DUF2148 domain-containing protein [Dorea sp. D27]KMZ53855.1 ferredoxin domain containing protein [Dorea sp. D27]